MNEFIEKFIDKIENEAFAVQLEKGIKHPSTLDAMLEKFSVFRIKEIVNQLAEEYNGGWIPVSDKLPDKDMQCLAIFESGNVDKIQYLASQKWWNGEMGDNRVIAWQPLPEPYTQKGVINGTE